MIVRMSKTNHFKFEIAEPNLENYALPPDDSLGELSDFELGLRRFCYECDRRVVVEIGTLQFSVFFDPDICMLLTDRFPEQIGECDRGKSIRIDFAENYDITIILTPVGDTVICQLSKFGYEERLTEYELDRQQVIGELRRFLLEFMELSVNLGYVSLEDKSRFIMPAFSDPAKVASLVG